MTDVNDDLPTEFYKITKEFFVKHNLSAQQIADLSIVQFCAFPAAISNDVDAKRKIFQQAMARAREIEAIRFGDLDQDHCIHSVIGHHIMSSAMDRGDTIDTRDVVEAFVQAAAGFIYSVSEDGRAAANAETICEEIVDRVEEMAGHNSEADDANCHNGPGTLQ